MLPYLEAHLERVKAACLPSHQVTKRSAWIKKNVQLGGKPFSFLGHEYQTIIADEESQVTYVRKPSQIGLTTLSFCRALAICSMYRAVTLMYLFPSMVLSQTLSKGSLAPIIEGSPQVFDSIFPGTDSAQVKRFLNDSFLYMRGASRKGLAISIPVDFLVLDELDFMEDEEIATSFTSRLTHSAWKNELYLSTPTSFGIGISDKFDHSRQFQELFRCNCCNFEFFPDYFTDVVIPGFSKDIRSINYLNRSILAQLDLSTAFLACRKCGKPVNRSAKFRHFVALNPESRAEAVGYQLSPFSASFISPGDLVRTATKYSRFADFVNFSLGLPYDDEESGLSREDLLPLFKNTGFSTPAYACFGLDTGGLCHGLFGKPDETGGFHVFSPVKVPLHAVRQQYGTLCSQNRVISTVVDSGPYTDLVLALQANDPNCWASVYVRSKRASTELYSLKVRGEDPTKAMYDVRQITVDMNRTFDLLVALVRAGKITFEAAELQEEIILHLTGMRRTQAIDSAGEKVYVWKKPASGDDHFFHSLVYLLLSVLIKGTSIGSAVLPFLLTSFKSASQDAEIEGVVPPALVNLINSKSR